MSVSSPAPSKKPLLSDQLYNQLKRAATIILPAIITLYFALSQIWHFPNVEQIMATLAALNTILGGTIQVSKKSYYASGVQYAGAIKVTDDGSKKTYSLVMNGDPETLDSMPQATFKVDQTAITPDAPVTPTS
jgi:hypothetical protein